MKIHAPLLPKNFEPKSAEVRIRELPSLLVRKMSALDSGQTPSPVIADVFYGRPHT